MRMRRDPRLRGRELPALTADSQDQMVQWAGGSTLPEGRSSEFRLQEAALYALSSSNLQGIREVCDS